MKKIVFITILLFIASITSFAQSSLQVYGSYIRNLNPDFGGSTFGGGVRFEFGNEDNIIVPYVGLGYDRPIITRQSLSARAFSNQTTPQTIDVAAVYKIPFYRVELGGRCYLGGSAYNTEGINFFLNGGAELILGLNKPKFENYCFQI